MTESINRAILLGALDRDAEYRDFGNGGGVVNLRVATSETFTDRQTNQPRTMTRWHTVSVFAPELIPLAQPLRQGATVYLEGAMESRKWTDAQGVDRYVTEVVCRFGGKLIVLSGTAAPARANGSQPAAPKPVVNPYPTTPPADDKIPF